MKKYDSYKDSGIEWIGVIPENWNKTYLKYCMSKIYGGGTPTTSEETYWSENEADIPWVAISDISSCDKELYLTKKKITEEGRKSKNLEIIPKGTLLLSIFASLGKTVRLGIDSTVNQAILGLEPNEKLHPKFLEFLLVDIERYISQFSTSSTQENLNLNKIKNLFFYIPNSIEEQTKIINYLDQKTTQIDHLISKKEQFIQLLEEERVAVINQAVTKGLDPNVSMKDSGIEWLGEIPEHWEVKKLKYVANLKSGENITSEIIKEKGDYPVYGGNGLRGYYSEFTNDGDYILIGRQGALCGNIKYAKNRFWASEHAIVCYLESNINWLWFGKLLESMNLNQYNQSAAQPGLAVGVIKNLSIPFPKTEQQNKIVEFIIDYEKRTDEIIEKTRNEIGLLKEYKTALISEVVTGKVDVRNEKLN